MTLYQRISLTTGENVGEPGPLPRVFQGSMTDADLARVGEIVPLELAEYADAGFVPYTPPATPDPQARWVHRAIFKRKFTQAERIAIRLAEANEAVPIEARLALIDFREVLDATEKVNLDDIDVIGGLAFLVSLGLLGELRPAQIRE